jgi:predicted DNA-binding protein (MmcQ/YjbR family)
MDTETLYQYCKQKPYAEECFPFDEQTLVFKVFGKMFALIDLEGEPSVNLKCDIQYAIELREEYPDIVPGYHMNKQHWNTVYLTRNLTDTLIYKLVDTSYQLIVASLPKKQQLLCIKNL